MTKVNKENWEYKMLGEICESIFSGGTPSRSIFSYWNGNIPWAKICDLRFMYLDKCEEFISKEGLANSSAKIFTKGTILYSIFATIGSSSILNIDASCNQAIAGIKLKSGLNTQFYFYVLKHLKSHFESISKGVAQKNINLSILKNQVVPVPHIEEQNRISSQFEEIDNLITLKQEQLKEFDALEQSVFYKMFGDLYSEMKWKTSLLKDVITLRNGRAYKQEELLPSGKYKVLRVGNFFSNNKFYYSDLELEDNKYCNPGDLLYTWSASFGARIWSGERCIYHYHIWRVDFDENIFNKIFLLYMLNNLTDLFKERLHGVGMMHLTKQMMEEKIIPLPPLSLQQSFAQKIETIEKQKTVVQDEITQLQALLDSEMDKYFG